MKLTFGDIVIVEGNLMGVVVKSWVHNNDRVSHEVYVRSYNEIREYPEEKIERYLVRHKELTEEEAYYQRNAVNPYIDEEEIRKGIMELGITGFDEEDWYYKKQKDLYKQFVGKFIRDDDNNLVEITSVDVEHRIDRQDMNRVTDEFGNKHFICDIAVLYTKEVK